MDPENRKSTHLKIARLLQDKGYSNESQDLLFTIALNYNLATDLVAAMPADAPDRIKLVLILLYWRDPILMHFCTD